MARKMKVHVDGNLPDQRLAPIDVDGAAVLVPVRVTFTDADLEIELTIDVVDHTPACTEYRVRRADGGDLALLTTEVARGVNLRKLLSHAVARVALEETEPGNYGPAQTTAILESILSTTRRRREPVSDESLRDFSEKYREHFRPGKMAEFAELIGYEERQAYRRLKLARERGFLPAKESE